MLKIISKLFKTIRNDRIILYSIILLSILNNFIFISYIDTIKRLINSVIALNREGSMKWIGAAIIIFLADVLFNRFVIILKKKLYCNSLSTLRTQFFKKLNTIPLPKLEGYINGDLITRFMDDISEVANFINDSVINVISTLALILIIFIYVGLNDMRLIPFVIILLPITSYLVYKRGSKLKDAVKRYQRELSTLNTKARDIFDYLMEIKSFRAEEFFTQKYDQSEASLTACESERNIHRTFIWGMGISSYQAVFIFFYGVGGFLAFKGYIEFGLIVGLFLLIDKLVDLLMQLPNMFSSIFEITPKINRVYEIIDMEEIKNIEDNTEMIDVPENIIEIKNLSYDYENGKSVLKDISINIKAGERIAVVGESGCGKSTLMKLLTCYDDRYRGSINILGKELREWPQKTIGKHISYCPQEPFLLSKSIIENFNMFYDFLDERTLETYGKMVEIDRDIASMEEKYNTIIRNGGKNLSGGQKQRLGLMLGLMKQSSIYMIDEGFSALDPVMTQNITNNIFSSIKNTVIIVTHKLYENLMTGFDRIIFMENGQITASGPHDELMKNQAYRSLYEKSLQDMNG